MAITTIKVGDNGGSVLDDGYQNQSSQSLVSGETVIRMRSNGAANIRQIGAAIFRGVPVENAEVLSSVKLRMYLNQPGETSPNVDIYLVDLDTIADWSTEPRDHILSSVSVPWVALNLPDGEYSETPELSSLFNPHFARAGWATGQNLGVVVYARDDLDRPFRCRSLDSSASVAMELVLDDGGGGGGLMSGACDLPGGGCVIADDLAACTALGGTFRGVGTTCGNGGAGTGDIYVDWAATFGAGAGTDNDPFSHPQEAADVAQPGDTVHIKGGIYQVLGGLENTSKVIRSNVSTTGEISGLAGSPITFQPFAGELVIFDGNADQSLPTGIDDASSLIEMRDSHHVNFRNLVMRNGKNHCAVVKGTDGIGSHNINFYDCEFFDYSRGANFGAGINYNGNCFDSEVEYSYFKGIPGWANSTPVNPSFPGTVGEGTCGLGVHLSENPTISGDCGQTPPDNFDRTLWAAWPGWDGNAYGTPTAQCTEDHGLTEVRFNAPRNIKIRRCVALDMNNSWGGSDGFAINYARNCEITECIAGRCHDDGFDMLGGTRCVLDGCVAYDSNPFIENGPANGNGFKTGVQGSLECVVKRCMAFGNESNGIEMSGYRWSVLSNTSFANLKNDFVVGDSQHTRENPTPATFKNNYGGGITPNFYAFLTGSKTIMTDTCPTGFGEWDKSNNISGDDNLHGEPLGAVPGLLPCEPQSAQQSQNRVILGANSIVLTGGGGYTPTAYDPNPPSEGDTSLAANFPNWDNDINDTRLSGETVRELWDRIYQQAVTKCTPIQGSILVDAGVVVPGHIEGFNGSAPDIGAVETLNPGQSQTIVTNASFGLAVGMDAGQFSDNTPTASHEARAQFKATSEVIQPPATAPAAAGASVSMAALVTGATVKVAAADFRAAASATLETNRVIATAAAFGVGVRTAAILAATTLPQIEGVPVLKVDEYALTTPDNVQYGTSLTDASLKRVALQILHDGSFSPTTSTVDILADRVRLMNIGGSKPLTVDLPYSQYASLDDIVAAINAAALGFKATIGGVVHPGSRSVDLMPMSFTATASNQDVQIVDRARIIMSINAASAIIERWLNRKLLIRDHETYELAAPCVHLNQYPVVDLYSVRTDDRQALRIRLDSSSATSATVSVTTDGRLTLRVVGGSLDNAADPIRIDLAGKTGDELAVEISTLPGWSASNVATGAIGAADLVPAPGADALNRDVVLRSVGLPVSDYRVDFAAGTIEDVGGFWATSDRIRVAYRAGFSEVPPDARWAADALSQILMGLSDDQFKKALRVEKIGDYTREFDRGGRRDPTTFDMPDFLKSRLSALKNDIVG